MLLKQCSLGDMVVVLLLMSLKKQSQRINTEFNFNFILKAIAFNYELTLIRLFSDLIFIPLI